MSIRMACVVSAVTVLVLTGCGTTAIRGATADDREAVTVTRVVDGDTFAVGERRIRPLGMDSCESNTPGGPRATADAKGLLGGHRVELAKQRGVDKDRYGRELRYVTVDGNDFAMAMVAKDHTEVYQGRNDASPEYVTRLRELDANGMDCSR